MAVKGDPLLKFITADWYNNVTNLGLRKNVGVRALPQQDQYWYITVRNHQDVPVPKWTAVSLGSASLDYESPLSVAHSQIIFDTIEYSADDSDNLAILLEPLPGAVGQTAKALLCGVSWIRVPESLPENLHYIHIEDIEPSLIPGLAFSNSGRIEILRTFQYEPPIGLAQYTYSFSLLGPSGRLPANVFGPSYRITIVPSEETGYLGLAIIGLKGSSAGTTFFIFHLREDFNLHEQEDGSGYAEADLYTFSGYNKTDANEIITVWNTLPVFNRLRSGDWGWCFIQDGEYYAIQAPCPIPPTTS